MKEEQIFALDIGTRSVTGVILEKKDSMYTLVDYVVREHQVRSMVDGQIHHVEAVASVIREVKEQLEATHGPLHKVSVAAAGRSLKTMTASASIELNQQPVKDYETVKHIELSAVHTAQQQLALSEASEGYSNYYCVGYSVLHYKLDHDKIGSLIDQSGQIASVDVIATFLPKVVVESLLSALSRANLEMDALTLEPIAAIQVLIPESMRRLNVALVDIGAGTSDIAITNNGTVIAYGMVPVAGDEITEAISDQYLLDFPIAEKTKLEIVKEGQATVSDILGFETTIEYQDLIKDVQSSIEKLAASIAEEIIQLNGSSPRAVMLIGGGSQTPDLTIKLANRLQLPINRVAIRDMDGIQILNQTDNLPKGPDFVTPVGIAIAANLNPIHYITIKVNEQTIRMFEMKQLTIGDCLVQAGIEISKLYGRPGIASIITWNGKSITLPGELGKAPTILLNNKEASVETFVQNGDSIEIIKGKDGRKPSITLDKLVGDIPSIEFYYEEQRYELKPSYYVNNTRAEKDYLVQDHDSIEVKIPRTIQDFFTLISSDRIPKEKEFTVYVNNQKVNLGTAETQVLVNGQPVSLDHTLKQNDRLSIIPKQTPTMDILLHQLDKVFYQQIKVTFNKEPVTISQAQFIVKRGDTVLDTEDRIQPDDHLTIEEKKLEPFIFQDVFRYIDIDLSKATGNFTLMKNSSPTTFFDSIKDGDQLAIVWD